MSRYAIIECEALDDEDFALYTRDALWLYFVYVIYCKNLLGIYQIGDHVAMALGRFKRRDIFEKAKKLIASTPSLRTNLPKLAFERNYVWVVGRAGRLKGEKQEIAGLKIWNELPSLELKKTFAVKYPNLMNKWANLKARYPYLAITSDTPSIGHAYRMNRHRPKPKANQRNVSRSTLKITKTGQPELLAVSLEKLMGDQGSFKAFTDDIQGVCRMFLHHRKTVFGEQFKSDKDEVNKMFGAMCNLSIYGKLRKPKDEAESITLPDKLIKIIERLQTKPKTSALRYLEWAVQNQATVLLA